MKKSAIYVRVSTNHQIDKDSLPLQTNDMINYSKFVLGIDNYEIFEDAGFSGKDTSRPAYQDMLNRIKTGEFSHLLVWKIDRISRNLIDFCTMYEELKKYNITFISKNEQFDTSSAMGEAMLKIILVFAELERKLTAERVTAVMIDRATKGLWNGAPLPLGYRWDNTSKFPVVDEKEKEIIILIYKMYKEYKSTTIIRNFLNENKLRTKRNGTWTTKTVSDIIRNPFYEGTYRYNYRESSRGKKKNKNEWIIIEDNHVAIITKELWKQCNDIMDLNAERNNAKFRSNTKTHIFSSLIECDECGNNMYAKQDKPHLDGYIPSIYACKGRYNKLGCTQKTVSDTIVSEFVLNFISNILKISKSKKSLAINELEKKLLLGDKFKDVIGIKEIDHVHNSIYRSNKNIFKLKKEKENNTIDLNLDQLHLKLKKYKKALNKLEDLYLFDEAEMSTKDYLIKKNTIADKIKEINKKLNNSTPKESSSYNINFILNVATFELSRQLMTGNIKIKPLITSIGRDSIKDFVNAIIKKIIVKDRQIKSIEFKNGLIVTFLYNS
ncbi:recombinase family protein [Clostridium sp. DSM 100503]|uniref:recombinase family protein n=1 Tax=Clostridium sp. DSM 100503 TaxID=2963282 RepID=UPI00214A7062|nr:recombinase family protein [Clostridium sp. DSM 100503]MCR1953172.1 recombinase family protein [Clostridium sp. DSM 100503]